MTVPGEQYSLRWNNYSTHIACAFDSLRSQEDFVDVTLCCEGRKIRAHKVLLSACSLYFRDVFKENPCQHPVIVFKNVKYDDLLALIEFMYQGEVSVQQEALPSFLATAEMLSVQGLTGGSTAGSSSTPTANSAPKEMPPLSTVGGNVATTTYVQTVPQLLMASQQQLHHQPMHQQQQQQQQPITSSKRGGGTIVSTIGDMKVLDGSSKTYSVQAVVNKTQVSAPISIPATVKLRTIPTNSKHMQQQQQHQQQHTIIQQQQTTIENVPMKKRRLSDVEVQSVTNADIEEAEFIVSDNVEDHARLHRQQTTQQQHQLLVDDVLNDHVDDDGEEEEEDEEGEEEEIDDTCTYLLSYL